MIDLLRVNQRLRAGVALKAAWEGLDSDLAAGCSVDAGPPESWCLAVVAAQLSWPQVQCGDLMSLQSGQACGWWMRGS